VPTVRGWRCSGRGLERLLRRKTPADLERLNREFAAAAKHPEVAKRFREMGAEPVGSSGAEQEAIFKRQMDQFRPIIKEMRIEG
jgi:tripartite-type tricarboxylate transporter receptor subunit TctC